MEITAELFKSHLTASTTKQSLDQFTMNNKGQLHAFELTIKGEIEIEKVYVDELMISYCNFSNSVSFKLEPNKSYYFYNCTFNEKVIFTDGENANLHLGDCEFGTLKFLDTGKVAISVGKSKGRIVITNSNYKRITIGDNVNDNVNELSELDIAFGPTQSGLLEISRNVVGRLLLSGTQGKDHIFVMNDNRVNHFIASQLTVNGSFKIHGLTAENKMFTQTVPSSNFYNNIKAKARGIYCKPIFALNKSDLSKSVFNNVLFSKFRLVTFSQSTVTEVHFIGCRWPKKIFSYSYWVLVDFLTELDSKRPIPKDEYLKRRENYRQLKVASGKQLDFVSEQLFHGKEMNAYFKSLSWWANIWTKIILRLSFWTSNYGQSFILPLLWVLGISSGVVFLNHYIPYGDSCHLVIYTDWITFLAEVFRLSNPLHKSCDLIGVAFILDMFTRIVSSYCIYNIIRATRRFVR